MRASIPLGANDRLPQTKAPSSGVPSSRPSDPGYRPEVVGMLTRRCARILPDQRHRWCRMNVSPTKTAEELIKRFDWQFKTGPRLCGSVPPSWSDVLFDLMLAIENLLSSEEQERFWWTDIKEKRGELRAYYVNDNEEDREWEVAMNQFAILFGERFTAARG